METILYSGLFWFVIFIIFVIGFAYLLKRWGTVTLHNAKQYDEYYKEIQHDINNSFVNFQTYEEITDKLDKLRKMKYKNPEKTNKLIENFHKKFYDIRLMRAIETNLKKKK